VDTIVILAIGGLAIAIWLSLKRLARTARKSTRANNGAYHPCDLPATVEQYPAEPRTRPRQLSWQQREVLSVAEGGRLIYPVPSDDQAHMLSDTHYYVQRRPVKALVRAGFLEYTPQGYRITPSGVEGLRRLPEKSN
jgi:hypothetical protein